MEGDLDIKVWEKLHFVSSREWLKSLREIELKSARLKLSEKTRTLRTNKLKMWRESRQAALFCYGLSLRYGTDIEIALLEDSDYDFVARWVTLDGHINYTKVQLKELVPDHLNPTQNLSGLFESISKKYKSSSNLVVAIYMNKAIDIDFSTIKIEQKMMIGNLWLFGCASEDQHEWLLYGDMLMDNAVLTRFQYPS